MKSKEKVPSKVPQSKKPKVVHEKTFSSFRVAQDDRGHFLQVRQHDMQWYDDERRFAKRKELRHFYEYELGMRLFEEGPYLADDQHPTKPACWSARVASKLTLKKAFI